MKSNDEVRVLYSDSIKLINEVVKKRKTKTHIHGIKSFDSFWNDMWSPQLARMLFFNTVKVSERLVEIRILFAIMCLLSAAVGGNLQTSSHKK